MTEGGERPSKSRMPLAVGCITFATERVLAENCAEYVAALERALTSVENVTELRFENFNSDYGALAAIKDPFDKTERYYYHAYNGFLFYRVFIPFKIQDELGLRCDCETFEVCNIYHRDHVVTYVPNSGAGDSCGGGATCLALVREYLKAKLQGSEFYVAIVGPSPFHATFWCCAEGKFTGLSDVSTISGIHEYEFHFAGGPINALAEFTDLYGETLAIFYLLHEIRSEILDVDRAINSSVENLLNKNIPFYKKIPFSKKSKFDIDQIHRKVIEAKSLRKVISRRLENADNDRLGYKIDDLAEHFVELRRISSENDYADALSIATVYEGRNRSFYQNSAVLIASLAGGLIGALLTSFFQGN